LIGGAEQEKKITLCNAEETFRIFYKMVEEILMLKEDEMVRQVAEAAGEDHLGTRS